MTASPSLSPDPSRPALSLYGSLPPGRPGLLRLAGWCVYDWRYEMKLLEAVLAVAGA